MRTAVLHRPLYQRPSKGPDAGPDMGREDRLSKKREEDDFNQPTLLHNKLKGIVAMTSFEVQLLDQEYRDFQDRIADEWRVESESDGDEGLAPEYPRNSVYLDGYNEGHARYINCLFDFKKHYNGRLCPCGLKTEQDCHCESETGWSDEF